VVVAEGVDPHEAVADGLAAAMSRVGDLYSRQEYFVPELLLCSDALYEGLEVLRPHLTSSTDRSGRKMILGVVEGDLHDIGKNLVKIMFEAAGWTVYDLGKDVPLERFAEEQARLGADIVALSALMTTSMLAIPEAVRLIRARDPEAAVMVGGAPLTGQLAESYGADGYADNAGEAVREAVAMIGERG
jgi:methanogenic corrinoid protein MtbC1